MITMVLFRPKHEKPIRSGLKTETRRRWKRCRVKVGSIHRCKTKMLSRRYFAKVRVLNTYRQALHEMRAANYRAEGGYTKASFIEAWKSINGSYDPLEVVWVVEFEKVEEKRSK